MNPAGEVLFHSPRYKLWKARALPLSMWIGSVLFALLAAYWLVTGEVSLEAFGVLLLAAVIVGHVGYVASFVLINPLELTATHLAPPSKPLTRPGPGHLVIPWRHVSAIEEIWKLYTDPDGVNYGLVIRTKDGRSYPFKALYVAWQTESTAEIRRAYEMVKAVGEALRKGPLERLDEDSELMGRLREILVAEYPVYDIFSRTRASKLAMAVGGPTFLAGLVLLLLPLEDPFLTETLSRILWILGGFLFLMGLSTKRAFAKWGRVDRSTDS